MNIFSVPINETKLSPSTHLIKIFKGMLDKFKLSGKYWARSSLY